MWGFLLAGFVGSSRLTSNAPRDSVVAMTDRLTGVINSLGSLRENPRNSQLSKVLAPYVDEMANVLAVVKNSRKPLSDDEKRTKLLAAQHSMENLAGDMAKFGQHLVDDDENERISILLGVLLSRKHDSMERQMEVLTDAQFQHLAAVKYVLKHHTTVPLVEQVAAYLDKEPKETRESAAKAKAAGMVEKNLKRAEENMAKAVHVSAKKILALEIKHLKLALRAIRKGNLEALRKVEADFKELNSRLDANVLVQVALFSQDARDCPYCKAQCIEKCHDNGGSFMSCLGTCASSG